MSAEEVAKRTARALAGNLEKDRGKLASANKLFVRDRIALLLDDGSFVEDALLPTPWPTTYPPTAWSLEPAVSMAVRCV